MKKISRNLLLSAICLPAITLVPGVAYADIGIVDRNGNVKIVHSCRMGGGHVQFTESADGPWINYPGQGTCDGGFIVNPDLETTQTQTGRAIVDRIKKDAIKKDLVRHSFIQARVAHQTGTSPQTDTCTIEWYEIRPGKSDTIYTTPCSDTTGGIVSSGQTGISIGTIKGQVINGPRVYQPTSIGIQSKASHQIGLSGGGTSGHNKYISDGWSPHQTRLSVAGGSVRNQGTIQSHNISISRGAHSKPGSDEVPVGQVKRPFHDKWDSNAAREEAQDRSIFGTK